MAKERTELRHRTAAMVDPLTGVANRRSFLQDASLIAKRHIGNPRPTAVLLIDLDHFKSINDRFGHAVGDSVLAIFAQAARKSMRGSDLIGRMGGEEFAAILLETSRDKASEVAERIRTSFARMAQEVEGHRVDATVSIGLVHCLKRVIKGVVGLSQQFGNIQGPPRSAAGIASSSRRMRCTPGRTG